MKPLKTFHENLNLMNLVSVLFVVYCLLAQHMVATTSSANVKSNASDTENVVVEIKKASQAENSTDIAAATVPSTVEPTQDQEIDIKSIDDGLLTAVDRTNSERHHYEQQSTAEQLVTESPAIETIQAAESAPAPATEVEMIETETEAELELASTSSSAAKPEPRNHREHQDPIIIDHRPSGNFEQQHEQQPSFVDQEMIVELAATTQSPQLVATPNSGAVESNLQPAYMSPPASSPSVTTTTVQYQNAPSSSSSKVTKSWHQHQHQQPQQANQQHVYTSYAHNQPSTQPHASPIASSSSNQVITVQHPTSINSIINDQQQQQSAQFSVINPQSTATQHISMSGGGQLMSTNQQPISGPQSMGSIMLNGQPTSLLVVSPSASPIGSGGRRISGWLRGFGSMLANMFNRRDHGIQPAGQSSNSIGHWIQLGPNAPHWLSQAQTLLHNHQQQLVSAGSARYATFVHAPQHQLHQQQQQQQPSIMTINMQPATILSGQSQPTMIAGGDLQASASSTTYQVSAVAPGQTQQQQKQATVAQYQQPTTSSSLLSSTAAANNNHLVMVGGGLQEAPAHMAAQSSGGHVISAARQAVVEQQPDAASTVRQTISAVAPTHVVNGSNTPSQQQSPVSVSSVNQRQQQQVSWPTPNVNAPSVVQQSATSKTHTLNNISQPRHNRSPKLASNQDLPLAHYSRHASSD